MSGNVDFYVKAISGRKQESKDSTWLSRFLSQLDKIKEDQQVKQIRCLALGSFTDFLNPRFQLALLSIMQEHLGNPTISAWDPAFNKEDLEVSDYYKIEVMDNFEESPDTSWYVPHGPFSLSVDLPLKIGNDIYIGNDSSSFDLDNRDKQNQIEDYKKHATISRLPDNRQDRWFAAFSSTAIHRKQLSP